MTNVLPKKCCKLQKKKKTFVMQKNRLRERHMVELIFEWTDIHTNGWTNT